MCGVDSEFGSDLKPTSTCTDLTAPGTFAVGTMSFTAPTNTVLVKETTYAVVVAALATNTPGPGDTWTGVAQGWELTFTGGEDADPATGWSLSDTGHWVNHTSAPGSWRLHNAELRIAIKGSAVGGTPPVSTDATLSALSLGTDLRGEKRPGGVVFDQPFASGTYVYTATVGNAENDVKVLATARDADATIEYLDASDTALSDPNDVELSVGANNVIKVKVTAEDDTTTLTYTVTVTRVAAVALTPPSDALVSTLGRGTVTKGDYVAVSQAFTTGSNADGYTLTGVDVASASSTGFTVQVCGTDSGGALTSDCTSLTAPVDSGAFPVGAVSFTDPANTVLMKETIYAVVVTATGAANTQGWGHTAWGNNAGSDDEDAGSAAGWSVANGSHHRLRHQTTITDSYRRSLRMAIRGSAVGGTASTDATLSALSLGTGVTLSPTFASGTAAYTASVANSVDEVTVTPTTNHASATVAYLDASDAALADADTNAAGHQVTLAVGDTVIKVLVTAEDGTSTLTYTVTVTPTLSVADAAAVTEGSPATFTVTLAPASAEQVTVNWTAVGGSGSEAQPALDFTAGDGTLTFAPGETTKMVTVETLDDALDEEAAETFTLALSSPTNALLAGGVIVLNTTGTINDNDEPPTLSVADVSAEEGNSLTFTVTLSAESGRQVTVAWAAATLDAEGDDAEEGTDFTAGSGTLTFTGRTPVYGDYSELESTTPGQTEKTFTVATTDDAAEEMAETFTVTLSGATNAGISDATAKGTITDNDGTSTPATCTLNTGDVWCGVLTVAAGDGGPNTQGGTPNGYVGAGSSYKGSDTFGALSDTDFPVTHEGTTTTYTIQSIRWGTGSDSEERLFFELDARPPNAVADTWTLQIGSYNIKIHGFDDWSTIHGAYTYFVGFGMTTPPAIGSTVTVRLRKAAAAPTNFAAAVGNAQVVLSWDAPDSGSGVTRHEYRQKEGTGSYPANFTQIADSGVGGANQAGFTVTGLTNEVVHTFQLRAVDASGDGTAAEAGPVTPTPGICGRTQKVHENIVYYLEDLYSVERTCAEVNVADLERFTQSLDMPSENIGSLKSGDFAGLTNLVTLNLAANTFTTLPADVFSGLTSLTDLVLNSGALSSIDARAFSGLTTLTALKLERNDLIALPGTVFSGLSALKTIDLQENDLTMLPANVFSGLSALIGLTLNGNDLGSLPPGLFSGLSALSTLQLHGNELSSLPAGLFSGLSALTKLHLHDNDLSSLPDGLLSGLTALSTLKLGDNPNSGDTLALTVTVEKFGTDQARAKVPAGAPFAVDFAATVANGSLPTGVTKLAVAAGEVNGTAVTVTRTSGMTGAVTVDVDLTTQPTLPTNHTGYEFEKATSGLPVEILRAMDSDATLSALAVNDGSADLTLTPAFSPETYAYAATAGHTVETVTVTPTKAISGAAVAYLDADDMAIADADTAAGHQVSLEPGENTIKVKVTATNMTDTLTYTLTVRRARPGICDRTEQIRTAILGEIAGVTDCADVTATHLAAITTFGAGGFGLFNKGITALQAGDFAGLTALTGLNLSVNQLTALPAGIFSDLTAVTEIILEGNQLASLPEGVFAGLTNLTEIILGANRLTEIPAGAFSGLTALSTLDLVSNRLTGLPDGTFTGLALDGFYLSLNPDLQPFAVTLEKRTGEAEVRAVVPVGAPFAVPVPVALDNGALAGGATAITVPAGATESDWVAVTRTAGTTGPVTVDVILATQPTLPDDHEGYAFRRGSGLPVTAIEATADDMPPDAPAGLMARHTTTAGEVALSWAAATGVASYQYRFRVDDGDYGLWTAIADSASGEANAAGFTVTGRVNGFPHTFQVRARGSGTSSGASNEAAATPGTGLGICPRTRELRDAIVSKIAAADDCAAVTPTLLAGLEHLVTSGDFQLQAGDLDGLTGLKRFAINDLRQVGLQLLGSGLVSLPAGIFSDLTNLQELYLGDNRLSTLPDGIFGGLSKLKLLSLYRNQLTALPDGVFEGLTSLQVLSLSGNPGSPLAVPVNLEKVGTDQVKAVAPTGAPFELALTVSLTDADPATVTLTVERGAVESDAATVARAAGKTGAVVASLGTLPSLPTSKPAGLDFAHEGYALEAGEAKTILPESSAPQNFAAAPGDTQVVLSWDAPASDSGVTKHQYRQKAGAGTYEDWTDIANSAAGEANVGGFTVTGLTNETAYTFELRRFIGTTESAAAEVGPVTPTPGICDRTQQVRDAIVARVSGAEKCNEVTVADLAGIDFLSIVDKGLTALEAGDFAGLTALEELSVAGNPSLTALPSGLFSGLTSLVGLSLSENGLETLPENVFSGLTALEQIVLADGALTTLPAGVFSGLTRVQSISLQRNKLTTLPADVFDGLTGLEVLQLQDNELTSLPGTVFSGLRNLELNLSGNDLTSPLPAGLFSGLGYVNLDLSGNDLTSLPDGLFSGLSSVPDLNLGDNPDAGDTLPLTVTLEKVGTNRVKAKVPAGAPFDVDVPVAVASGTLDGGATVLRVATGSVESAAVAVTRTEGTYAALTVDIDLSNQPALPSTHSGYAFARAAGAEAVEIEPSQAPPLPAPTGLAATPGDGRATLVWDEAASDSGVTRHEYRYEADGDRTGWTAIPDSGPGGANASRYTVTGLANGRAHVFELRAVGDEGEGAAATVTVEPTGPPRILSVEVTSGPGLDNGQTYGEGEEIRIEVTFDQPVVVTGDPELALDVGGPRLAGLESGGGTEVLVFVYVVTEDDEDADGVSVGRDALRLDAGDGIGNPAGDDADRTHDGPGTLSGHKVDGERRGDVHDHGEFTHGHSVFNAGKRYHTQEYPEHRHEGHEHSNTANGHSHPLAGHVHHAQEDPNASVGGPDERSHDGVDHIHRCFDVNPRCNKGDAFTSGTPGLPIEVTHDHANAEPGHGYDWRGEYFEEEPPAPTGVTATPGAGQVRLAWEVPALEWDPQALAWVVPAPGLPAHVTHHEYRWTTDGDDVGWTAIPDSALFGGNQAGFTVTGLADGKTYTFEFRAANAGGGGPPVQAENVTTATVPEIEGVEVASTPDRNATYVAGDGIRIEVTFDQAVEVEGDPEFGLSVGGERVAEYRWGSDTEVLVFVYTVRPEDRDRDGIWIGEHDHAENPTFRLDGDDRIRNAAGQDADLSHSALGLQRNHKVNGGGESPGEDEHSHQEFTHSHGHSRGPFAQVFTQHGHAYHVHDDTNGGHLSAMRPGQHVHHVQENLSGDSGPDLREHGGVEHTHWCGDIEPDCNPDKETVQVADELGLPVRVTHAHTDSEPGHRFGWTGYFAEAGSDPLLSVMGAEATEGDDGALDFVVRLDREPRSEVTVRYATTDGTAAAGQDYTRTAGTLTFGPGETAKTVRVPILDDTVQDDGETLTLALSNASSGAGIWSQAATATGTIHNREEREGPAPLTARFVDMPPEHDGEDAFTFRVAFSENIGISYRSLREDAFEVAGGRVTRGARMDDRRDLFEMTVEPDGEGAVTVTLPAGRECAVSGAICTKGENRRQLTNTPTATVAGPAVEETAAAPLTASFEGMPVEHDGASAFTFRVAFSENIGISYRSLREDAFEVSGGRVTRGERVDDRRDLFEMTVEPDGGSAVTVTLPAGRECSVSGAICTKGENRRQLTNTPTATVAGPEVETAGPALTASFVDMPSEHDGKAFTLRLAFSEEIGMSGRRLRSDVVAVSGGRATKAAPVNGRKDLWTLTVRPDSLAAVTVTLAGGAACDTPAAVCTADGKALSGTVSTTVRGPVALSVADARAREGKDPTLDFAVSLSRASSGRVTVDYATVDGSAKAGADYEATSGTLSFAPGETAKTVAVAVLDDAHDEGTEVLVLRLENARGARLGDRLAVGWIENTDHMPAAWLARFGRTVGSHVVDALGERLEGGAPSHVTVGGIRLTGAPGAVPEADTDDPFGLPEWATKIHREEAARTLTRDDLLLRSAFHLSSGGGEAAEPAFTTWGRVSMSGFEAEVDDVTMDGDVTTGLIGFDAEWERVLAGVMVSQSKGEGDYRLSAEQGGDAGSVKSSLTGVYPYARLALSGRMSAWALAGVGSGELTLRQTGKTPMPTDIAMRMGAVGVEGQVLDGTGASGVALNVKSDAMWVGTKSARTHAMAATEGDVTRLRLIVEGERSFEVASGATFTPSAQLGVRHDGGDAETGTGVEVGAGLRYTVGAVTIEAQARALLAHEASDYEEWGMSGAIRVTPGASGRGLTLSIAPAWGHTGSAAERLWSARDASALGSDSEFEAESRLEMDVGYGFGLPGNRGVLTPYAGMTLGDARARTVRTGTRWQLGTDAVLGLETTRQTSDAGETDNRLMLRAALRF